MDRISIFKMSGLPDPFGVVVLIFSFILLLSPYLAGSDFGVFKVPAFGNAPRKWLKIIGPIVFLLAILAYLPIFGGGQASLKESSAANPELKPLLAAKTASMFEGFTGGKLPGQWTALFNDQKNWTVQSTPPSLLIVTQKGSIWGNAKDLKNQFRLDRDLPATDFEVIIKASFQIQGTGNAISAAIFKDDDNFIEIGYWGQVWGQNIRKVMHFTKEEAGIRNEVPEAARGYDLDTSPVTFYLKIERQGHQFTGYYSFVENRPPENVDDIRWSKMGTHAWINFNGKLSLWASNVDADPPQTPARFDFVLIRPLNH